MQLEIETPRAFAPLLEPARYKGAHGGRGSGKSHFFAESLIEDHLRFPGLRSVCIREVQRSLAQSVKRLLEDKIVSLGVSEYFEVREAEIRCPGNGIIIFQGMQNHTSDSIKSLEGYRRAWVEEAQTLSQRSLDLLRPTLRAEDAELWFSWNPSAASDPVDSFLRADEPFPGSVVVNVSYADNPWFPDSLRTEMEYDRARDPDKYAHVWMGEYLQRSEARVFHNWRVEEFDIPQSAIIRQGADWGFARDPSVLVQCFVEGKKLFVPHEAYMIGCEIDSLPNLFATLPDADKWWITADSARPETISYMQQHGFKKMGAAAKGKGSIDEGVEFLKSFDIVVHPRCKHTIDELSTYAYETDPLTEKVLPKLKDKNNHVIDALRYACEGARKATTVKRERVLPDLSPHEFSDQSWMA